MKLEYVSSPLIRPIISSGVWVAGEYPCGIFEVVEAPAPFTPSEDGVLPMAVDDSQLVPMQDPDFTWGQAQKFVKDRDINSPVEAAFKAVQQYRKTIMEKNNVRTS